MYYLPVCTAAKEGNNEEGDRWGRNESEAETGKYTHTHVYFDSSGIHNSLLHRMEATQKLHAARHTLHTSTVIGKTRKAES